MNPNLRDAQARERELNPQFAVLSAEFVDGARASAGIVLGTILGLLLWLLIILATVSLL